jgi:Glu-tRNA(Gln) amidotransferase subunit E-like FAD-binding protein
MKRANKGEDELMKRLEEFVATAENDLKLLREILERI